MAEAVKFPLESGGTVYLEVLKESVDRMKPAGFVKDLGEDAADTAGRTLQEALGTVKAAAGAVVESFKDLEGPDSIGLEFNVGFKLSGDAVIVSGETNASFKVTLNWKKSG